MFIVLELNQDEFGRGNSRPVNKFDTEAKMLAFVTSYRGDASRLEIFRATPLTIKVEVVEAKPLESWDGRNGFGG